MDKEKGLPRQMTEEAAKTYMDIHYPPQDGAMTPYESVIVRSFVQYGMTDFDFVKSFRATKGARSYWKEGSMREGCDVWTEGEKEDGSVLIFGFRVLGIPVGFYACREGGLYGYDGCDSESYWIHFAILSNEPADHKTLDGYCGMPFGFGNMNYFRDTREAVYMLAYAFGLGTKGL